MVIGSSNVGKSTYCRTLVNSLLNRHQRVAMLDVDVGQNEFATEGILSLTVLDTPQFRSSCVPNINNDSMYKQCLPSNVAVFSMVTRRLKLIL